MSTTTPTTAIPAQRSDRGAAIHYVTILAELVVDHVRSGVAGPDAAEHVNQIAVSTDPAVLLATLAASDLSDSARFGVLLAAYVAATEALVA